MKLIITSAGDMAVGIFPQKWEVECPFEMDEGAETLEGFRSAQVAIYQEFDVDIRAEYDFEVEERHLMEDEGVPDFGPMWESYQKVQAEREKRDAWAAG